MVETLLTPDELAGRWNASKSFVYLLSSSGRLRKVKLGNLLRFRLSDVQDYERKNTIEIREPIEV